MAIKTTAELLESLKGLIGENTSDEAIGFTEDLHDTLSSLSDATDWKNKYETNDKEWRQKYRDRFFSNRSQNESDESEPITEPTPKKLTFESLFKED